MTDRDFAAALFKWGVIAIGLVLPVLYVLKSAQGG